MGIEHINGVKPTNNYLLIWSQIEYGNEYNFSNYEKKYINNVKDIIKNGINNYTVYKYGYNFIKEINILFNKDIDKIYNNMVIKERKDIDITYDDILSIIKDNSKINDIYIDLEKQILYNKLKNQKQDIISYLEGEYSE